MLQAVLKESGIVTAGKSLEEAGCPKKKGAGKKSENGGLVDRHFVVASDDTHGSNCAHYKSSHALAPMKQELPNYN